MSFPTINANPKPSVVPPLWKTNPLLLLHIQVRFLQPRERVPVRPWRNAAPAPTGQHVGPDLRVRKKATVGGGGWHEWVWVCGWG
ncbi:hypothetical protein Pyn_39469 [Prunus yedoensis var. nudiflora]|uniref:Uncharacterized protein n=1 Tax=Prunus yedoensis var. nudiflora TaxID=2094558 RepID=A0A314Z7C1_PRUYE|nr:hypothetical protein Pyn_39469 [Prunus yedoensis var. nudiflora]